MKTDLGKRRYDLIPPQALALIADVFTHGTKHDKPRARSPGFMNLKGATRLYTASLFRHWEAWRGGQRTDPDSGLPHLAHVASNAIILLALELRATKEQTMSGKNSAAQFKETYGARTTFTGGMLDPFGVGIVGLNPKHPMFRKDLDVPLDDWTADLWDQARLTVAEKDPVPPDAILAIGGPRHAIKVTNRRGLVLCVDGRRTIIGCRLAVMKQKAAKVDPAEYIELIAIVDKSKDLDVSTRLANSGRRDDPPWVKAANALYLDGRKKPHTVIMACLDNCDRHTLNNYLAYGNAVPEIKAQVENTELPKDQRVPFMVAVHLAALGEGETKRQLLALAYMRAAGLQMTGEQGRTNASQVVKAILDGKITDKSLATIQKDPPKVPAAAPSSPASASSPSPATSTPTAASKPQDRPTTKSSQPREVIPGVVTVRALKPKLIALAQANLEPTGDEPLETEAGRAGLAVLNVITGQDPTGDGLKEFPELAAAFRKVLPSATVTA